MKARTQPDSSRCQHVGRPLAGVSELQGIDANPKKLARVLHSVAGMEPNEISRLEMTLVVAACFPFLMMGLLFLFA
jgi:hypothetical protein